MAMTNVFTGKNGTLQLSVIDSPEGADAKAVFQSYGGTDAPPIARVTNVKVFVQTDLEEFHQIGLRHPVSLHPGDIHIFGTIERAYVSGALLSMLLGRGVASNSIPEPYVQPVFGMILDLKDPAVPGNEAKLVLDGVKLQNWAQTVPEDDFVLENVDFRALTIHVIDTEAAAGGGSPTEHKPFAT
jgi:hypothetical protein